MKHVVSFFINRQSFDGHQSSFCRRLPLAAPMLGGPTVSVFLADLKQPLARKINSEPAGRGKIHPMPPDVSLQ
jgi:hypothetical protein